MLIKLLNPVFHNGERNGKVIDPESVSGTGSPPKINHFQTPEGYPVPMPIVFGRRPLPLS